MQEFSGQFTNPTGSQYSKTSRHSGAFPDPYLDYASTQMPRSIYDVLRWCEFVAISYGTYRMALQRVVRYFLTKIELTDADDDEKEKYEEFLEDHLHIMEACAQVGDNFMVYGNSFTSLNVPFRRYLRCPKCSLERPIHDMAYTFTLADLTFTGKCNNPKCKHQGKMVRSDRNSIEQDKLKITHWNPHELKLMYHPITQNTTYFWDIPSWYRREIEKGNRFYLESTPWEVVEAIKKKQWLQFEPDYIYHMREESLAGIWLGGWGLPRMLSNFRQAWYVQILKRYNEAIALDYIIPFRVITPKPGTSREADPLIHQNMGQFTGNVMEMFKHHRRDPTTIHALPFPIEMALMGAEGRTLAPIDLLNNGTDELLNASGVPAELYKGTLQLQAMPGALRLFERTWVSLVTGLNGFLAWVCDRISDLKNWENLKARLQSPTLAEDLERKNTLLQLAAGQQISQQTALAPFGINVREETRRKLQEQGYIQEETAKFQEEQAHKQEFQKTMAMGAAGQLQPTNGAPAGPGGAPAPGQDPNAAAAGGAPAPTLPSQSVSAPGGSGVTPDDMMQQAEQIAYQLLGMPYEMRKSEMLKIKKTNETMHALIVSKIQSLRQTAQQQGGMQMMQQQMGAQAG